MNRPDALVVGAGFAGLTAAVELTRAGLRVLVLEARGRLGGRASAYQDRETGEWVDNGQHVLAGCYHETRRLLAAIGAADTLALQRTLEVGFVDGEGRESVLACPNLPPPFHLAAGVLRWKGVGWRDRLALARIGPALLRRAAVRIPDGERVWDWLVRHGQTPRLIEMLWEPLALAALNQHVRVAAARPFAVVLSRMFLGATQDASLGLPRVSLEHFYAEPARRLIERGGGEVRVHALTKIAVRRRRLERVEVRGEALEVPAVVIAAVPWFGLRGLLRDEDASLGSLLDRADATAPSPILTVNLWLDRPIVERAFVGLPGRRMQWVFDKARLYGQAGLEASHLSLVSSGADEILRQSNDEIVSLAMAELRSAFPAAAAARVHRATVVRETQATYSVAPGQPQRPGVETTVAGLWLAGDWVETGLPGVIEGAVLSGRMAAEAAMRGSRSG